MAIFKNSYEVADERKRKNDFVSAMSELKTGNSGSLNNNQSSFVNKFNEGYTQAGGQGNGLNNLGSMFGQKLASFGGNKGAAASGSSGGGTPWGLIGQVGKQGYNAISGKDDKDYSDTEESIIYPLQGASMGAQFGPWGAAGGALYGLGYSLKDDIGLKDSNFFTKMLFPIGMGDNGGFIDLG